MRPSVQNKSAWRMTKLMAITTLKIKTSSAIVPPYRDASPRAPTAPPMRQPDDEAVRCPPDPRIADGAYRTSLLAIEIMVAMSSSLLVLTDPLLRVARSSVSTLTASG
jgi:hypothetical protein